MTSQIKTLATFATSLRASSLQDDLNKAGIDSCLFQAKWTNKRLPPPRFEVQVSEALFEAASVVLEAFKKEGRR